MESRWRDFPNVDELLRLWTTNTQDQYTLRLTLLTRLADLTRFDVQSSRAGCANNVQLEESLRPREDPESKERTFRRITRMVGGPR